MAPPSPPSPTFRDYASAASSSTIDLTSHFYYRQWFWFWLNCCCRLHAELPHSQSRPTDRNNDFNELPVRHCWISTDFKGLSVRRNLPQLVRSQTDEFDCYFNELPVRRYTVRAEMEMTFNFNMTNDPPSSMQTRHPKPGPWAPPPPTAEGLRRRRGRQHFPIKHTNLER
jgi:hypothetical protein